MRGPALSSRHCRRRYRCLRLTGLSLRLLRVPRWRNGRRRGLKILRGQPRAGSSPALGTRIFPDSAAISRAMDFGCQVPCVKIVADFG
jgi:hypothetical protein